MTRALARVGVLMATVALVLVGFELGLRAFWGGFYLKGDRTYVEPNATRGWSNKPSTTAVYGEAEFHFDVNHDAHGFRGPEIAKEKAPGKLRVLVLGDSFTYGIGVADDETFSARLEALDPRYEVLNTGVNGYGTAQELLLLRDQGLALRPDVVVVVFFWNDVGNNYVRAFPRFQLSDGALVWPEPMVIEKRKSEAPKRRGWLRHSYVYRFVSDRLKIVGYRLKLLFGIPLETQDFVENAEREAAWQLTGALLREIRDQAATVAARTLVVAMPDQVQVETDVTVLGLAPVEYEVQERLRAICELLGVPFVDLLPALREAYARAGEPLYYPKDRHLKAPGHAIVAQALAAELDRLVPPGAGPK
ncbi:MAG: SGNH/GDSL hydrolase family protein [Myxococcota bacterium]